MRTFHLPVRIGIFLTVLFCLDACKDKEEAHPGPANPAADTAQAFAVEEAYPGMECVWQDGTLLGEPIRYGIINGEAIFEGDIILSPEQLAPQESPNGRISGMGISNKIKRWRGFTIPYIIDPNLPKKNRVTDAIAHWEAKTPLRFVLRTNEPDYIKFTTGAGCASEFGRKGGEQTIRLFTCPVPRPGDCGECTTGLIIHEIGHAVGLLHEHTRSDRDKYITFHKENVIPNKEDNFLPNINNIGFDFGTFDFNSIMLYSSDDFSANGKSTLTRKDGSDFTAQRVGLSQTDIGTVVSMYANLYVVKGGKMYAVALSEGWGTELSGGWSGFNARTMAEDQNDRYLWAIHGQTLYQVDRLTGGFKDFGGGWDGAVGITGIPGGTTRWAIRGKDLYAINPEGVRKDVDNFDWSNSKAIYAHRDFLFVVDGKGHLWKWDLNTQKWHDLGGGWGTTKAIAAANSDSEFIYILAGLNLWRVDGAGKLTQVGPSHWAGAEGMVGIAGKLYIVANDNLWEVDSNNGNRRAIINGWGGIQSMGIIRNGNIL